MARPSHAGPSHSRSRRPDQNNPEQWQWPGPGIFVKVDIGIALTPSKAKQVSLGYVSKNMQRIVQSQRHPERMRLEDRGVRTDSQQPVEEERRRPAQRQRRSRSALQLRPSPVSPEAVIISSEQHPAIDYHPFHPEPVYFPSPLAARESPSSTNIDTVLSPYRPSPTVMGQYPPLHANSYPPPQTPVASSSREPPLDAVRQTTVDRKPLPPLPSVTGSFRLGSDDLPWSTPTIMGAEEPTYLEPLTYSPPRESRRSRRPEAASNDDPQRTRELSQLNQAMIGVGSLDLGNEWWEPEGNFDRLGEIGTLPRGPRGVGWAIAVPAREEASPARGHEDRGGQHRYPEPQYDSGYLSPPPAYTQGQWGWDWEWEESYGYWVRVRGLRRSSSIR